MGILILGLSVSIIIDERNKEVKTIQKDSELEEKYYDLNQEVQRTRLIERGLTDSQIESLGENPLLKQAYDKGQESERIGSFKEAIESYEEILKFRLSSNVDKVSAYNLVGNCYSDLYELEKAIFNFQKASDLVEKLKDEKDKSNGKMKTFYNIGCIYKKLSLWKDAQKYLEYSLKESDKLDDYLQKADVLLNISNIYYQLNKPKIAIKKLIQSIQAYQEALRIFNPEHFPMDYARTQNNLGAVYGLLSKTKDIAENSYKAIQTFQKSLQVYTSKDFPINYAMTQYNLGTVYSILADTKDTAENCDKAIQAFQEALKVYIIEDFPMDYAKTQYNLGNTYYTLAEVKDKVDNCNKAIQANQEILKAYPKEEFPEIYLKIEERIKKIHNL